MALSGTLNSPTFGPSGHYKLQMSWTATQNTSANTSTVTVQMKMWSDSGWSMSTGQTHSGNISLDPNNASLTNHAISDSSISTGGGVWVNIGSAVSQTMTHNSDGSLSFALDGNFDFTGVSISGTALGNVNFTSTSFTLNTIPRETKLASPNPPSWTAGNTVTFSLTRYSSSFSETVTLEVQKSDNSWTQVGSTAGLTTSATFGNTTTQNTTIFSALNGRASCASRLTITTYASSGSTGGTIGSAQIYTGTVTAPAASTGVIGNPANVSEVAGQESSTVYADQSITINITSKNSAFTHTVNFKDGNSGNIIHQATGVTTSVSWTPSTTVASYYSSSVVERDVIYKAIPSDIELDGQVDIYTYYNGVLVQSSTNLDINYRIRNSNPTFTATGVTYKDNATAISTLTGNSAYIVQNASDLLVSLPTTANATATNYATMAYYVAQCGGSTKQVNYSSSATITFDLGKINLSASDKIYITAYDSRGFSTQASIPVTIVPWKVPSVVSTSKRNDGFTDPSTITLTGGTYSKVLIGATAINDIYSVKYQYAVKATPQTYPASPNAGCLTDFPGMVHSNGTFSAPDLAVTLASGSAWQTEVLIVDKIMNALGQAAVPIDNVVPVGTPILFIDTALGSVGIGKFPSSGTTNWPMLDINTSTIPEAQLRITQGTSATIQWFVRPSTTNTAYTEMGLYDFTQSKTFFRYKGDVAQVSIENADLVLKGVNIKYQSADGTTQLSNLITTYDGDTTGNGVAFGANGATAIGGGESAVNLFADTVNGIPNGQHEALYVASDNEINFYMGVQSGVSAAKKILFNADGALIINPFATAGTSTSIRMVTSGTTSFIQSGASTTDTSGGLVFARYGSTTSTIPSITFYATTVKFPSIGTTANAGNTYLDSSFIMYKSTSSIRYKEDIEDLWASEAKKVLDLRPVIYRSKAPNDRKDWSYLGLIAEEVAEVEPRLVHYTQKDDDKGNPLPTSELEPDGVQYERLPVMMLAVLQQHEKEIQELKKKLKY